MRLSSTTLILTIQGITLLVFLISEVIRIWLGIAYYNSPFSDIRGICVLLFVFFWFVAVAIAAVKYATNRPPRIWWVVAESTMGIMVISFLLGMIRIIYG